MKPSYFIMGPLQEHTVRIQLTDASQLLSSVVDTALGSTVDWSSVKSALITCETYDCRIAFGVSASSTVGHILYVGQSVRIPSRSLVSEVNLINKTAGQNSIIQVTLEH